MKKLNNTELLYVNAGLNSVDFVPAAVPLSGLMGGLAGFLLGTLQVGGPGGFVGGPVGLFTGLTSGILLIKIVGPTPTKILATGAAIFTSFYVVHHLSTLEV